MKTNNTTTVIILAALIIVAIFISGHLFSIACPSSQVAPNTGGGCYTPPTITNVPPPLIVNGTAIWGNGNCIDITNTCYIGFVWDDINTTTNGVSNYSDWSFCNIAGGNAYCYGLNTTHNYNIYLGSNESTGAIANKYNEQTLTTMQNILNYYKYSDCVPYDACYEGLTQAVQIQATATASYPVIIEQLQQAIAYNNALPQSTTTTTQTTTSTTTPSTTTTQPTTTTTSTTPTTTSTAPTTTTPTTTTTQPTTTQPTTSTAPTTTTSASSSTNIFTQITALLNNVWQTIIRLI